MYYFWSIGTVCNHWSDLIALRSRFPGVDELKSPFECERKAREMPKLTSGFRRAVAHVRGVGRSAASLGRTAQPLGKTIKESPA